ncbi:hypothetical protein KSF_082290 [Reticulibacter mediterranei]|uniref:Uncharacterized protein n=1 Tax=Reticulibacter mediterranei TaxID=2778369 RepID=A0A8J3IZN3_9CHLR|nr:hypothetical protein KSF_082290 [Reticulibacter mediterranei]
MKGEWLWAQRMVGLPVATRGRALGDAGALRLSLVGRGNRETNKRCGESDKRKAPTKTPNTPCRYGWGNLLSPRSICRMHQL